MNRLLLLFGFFLVYFVLCAFGRLQVPAGALDQNNGSQQNSRVSGGKQADENGADRKANELKIAAQRAISALKMETFNVTEAKIVVNKKLELANAAEATAKKALAAAKETIETAEKEKRIKQTEEKLTLGKKLLEEAEIIKDEAATAIENAKKKKSEIMNIKKQIEQMPYTTSISTVSTGGGGGEGNGEAIVSQNVAQLLKTVTTLVNEAGTHMLAAEHKMRSIEEAITETKTKIEQTEIEKNSDPGINGGYYFVTNSTFGNDVVIPDSNKCNADEIAKTGCQKNSKCYKVEDGFLCLCFPGFVSPNAKTTVCVKNETMTCAAGSHNCSNSATCKFDALLGIGCKCNEGSLGDGIFCSNSLSYMMNLIFVIAIVSLQLIF